VKPSILAMLNDAEQDLVRQTDNVDLAGLDEEELLELHARVRRARDKYSKLYRRRASAQVAEDSSREEAHPRHARTGMKAEVFEDALARVSRHLARPRRVTRLRPSGRGHRAGPPPAAPNASARPADPSCQPAGADRKRSRPSRRARNRATSWPLTLFPATSSGGAKVPRPPLPGETVTMPPPMPLLPGSPTS